MNNIHGFEKKLKDAINAARELCYSQDTITKIKNALKKSERFFIALIIQNMLQDQQCTSEERQGRQNQQYRHYSNRNGQHQ